MRTRLAAALAATLMALVVGVAPAAAIQFGQPDGNGHPYVGLVTFMDADQVPLWRCTGTLIDSTHFLTAGHCTGIDPATGEVPASAQIFFSATAAPVGDWAGAGTSCAGKTGYPCQGDASGTPHPNPGWTGYLTLPDTHDVGMVVLDQPYLGTGGKFGALPSADMLSKLATQRGQQDLSMTVVGYGVQSVKPVASSLRDRLVATVKVVQLGSALTDGYNVRLSSNPGYWSGGTCFGDSGGPIFYNDSNVVVGVNSFVLNANCKGSGYAYRIDTPWSLAFIDSFMP